MSEPKNHIVIAIDGPSGTGKSTTAKMLSKNLGITYLDTGAMYRAITFVAMSAGVTPSDKEALLSLLQKTVIDFDSNNQVLINGFCQESAIRSPEVSEQVSYYSAVPEIRSALTAKQREIGNKHSCILDGRDIGTVVFPNAAFKFFLVTDLKVRAARRYAELIGQGKQVTLQEVEENLRLRDSIDSSREIAPLLKAPDAIEIDTTQLSIQQQVEKIQAIVSVVA